MAGRICSITDNLMALVYLCDAQNRTWPPTSRAASQPSQPRHVGGWVWAAPYLKSTREGSGRVKAKTDPREFSRSMLARTTSDGSLILLLSYYYMLSERV